MDRAPLSYRVVNLPDHTRVTFSGVLDERGDLSELARLHGAVVFDLAEVRRVTSCGVTRWLRLLESLSGVDTLAFERCSLAIVAQLNMVRGFRGKAEVRSFFAPYISSATGDEVERLLTPAEVPERGAPRFSAGGGTLELNDLPERYFAFLRER